MIKETVIEEIQYFQSLSYELKLKYFDEQQINFVHNTHFFDSYDLFITIKPSNRYELIFYNKWLIDHWRRLFREDLEQLVKNGFISSFKYFEELKNYFISHSANLNHTEKFPLMVKEIETIGKFVSALKIERNIA